MKYYIIDERTHGEVVFYATGKKYQGAANVSWLILGPSTTIQYVKKNAFVFTKEEAIKYIADLPSVIGEKLEMLSEDELAVYFCEKKLKQT